MDTKASEFMGESVIAGVSLEDEKALKNAISGTLGKSLGGAVGGMLSGDLKPASSPGGHKGPLYVAVGPSKVGFFSVKQGFLKPSIKDILAEHPRNDVLAVEIGSGYMPTVFFVFKDGSNYVFKCAKINVKNLKKVQKLFAQ